MEVYFIKGAQLILSLSILVVLHELGHFIPAKLFKTRVEKFYLFFDPWFSLFKFKKGDTEYGIGWLPLGGYVKISGMIDESMDKEAMALPPKDYEFRSKPAWQRLIIMIGGVTVNILLGFLIYSMVLYTWGEERIPLRNLEYGVTVDSTLMDYGMMNGDKVLGLPGQDAQYLGELGNKILVHGAREILIERNGVEQTITLPEDFDQVILAKKVKGLFSINLPFVVKEPTPNDNAAKAGILADDQIVAINDTALVGYMDGVQKVKSLHDKTAKFTVLRNGEEKDFMIDVSDKGTIGISLMMPRDLIETETREFGFFESIPAGVTKTGDVLGSYVSSMSLIFTKEGASSLGGFGAIGGLFAPQWDWEVFWSMTAFLSIVLAFMNILPIPALDGGHVLFLIYEMITGRKPGEKFLEYAQTAGMLLLLLLLLYANGNDIIGLLQEKGIL
ncbi:MAG: RIP metalloprotease RseP [Salibacteraceae bacterium]|nr:RIP metalloprotease RseP [Salibacteraceae bacterium]